MKSRQLGKKISLKKETIANLNNGQLDRVVGGLKLTGFCTEASPLGQSCVDCPSVTLCTICITCNPAGITVNCIGAA